MKIIFVTGGVASSLGKGIVASSMASLLKTFGYRVEIMKFDPYLNVDPGTMNPMEHGEVYVTADGGETDLDLGHYERFTGVQTTKGHSVTSGQIYQNVIEKERRGDYLGSTVQVIPHVTDEITSRIVSLGKSRNLEVLIVEIGGTIGDIESLPFIEAARQIPKRVGGRHNVVYVHVTWMPFFEPSGEYKTKPTQHSVKALRENGISADIIVCRSKDMLSLAAIKKISDFCDVPVERVFTSPDLKCIYDLPKCLYDQKAHEVLRQLLGPSQIASINPEIPELVSTKITSQEPPLRIGLVGKYTKNNDAYLSVREAIIEAARTIGRECRIVDVDSEKVAPSNLPGLASTLHGIVIPGGFGPRGIEGKILFAEYARKNNVPFLGICLGMQVAIIEYARNVSNMPDANSTEFDEHTEYPVIDLMVEQKSACGLGGTMRLGNYQMMINPGTKLHYLYGNSCVKERHRHRYEVNDRYIGSMEDIVVSGTYADGKIVEAIEIAGHPFYIGCQFHPEFNSVRGRPHPLFVGLIHAAAAKEGFDTIKERPFFNLAVDPSLMNSPVVEEALKHAGAYMGLPIKECQSAPNDKCFRAAVEAMNHGMNVGVCRHLEENTETDKEEDAREAGH